MDTIDGDDHSRVSKQIKKRHFRWIRKSSRGENSLEKQKFIAFPVQIEKFQKYLNQREETKVIAHDLIEHVEEQRQLQNQT